MVKKGKTRSIDDSMFLDEYNEGVQAKVDGSDLDDCPYAFPKTEGQVDGQRKNWMRGWLDKRYEKYFIEKATR